MKSPEDGYSRARIIMAILLVIVIALAAATGTYIWQHNKVNDLNSKVNSLNTRIENFNNQISTLSGKLSQACQSTQQTNPVCANYTYTSPKGISVFVYATTKNAMVTSPVAVVGEVPGNWSFEAQFPVQLKDSKGNIVAQAPANLLGAWQTSDLVPFSAQLTFSTTESGSGTLVLQKDNPSGLPKNSDFVSIPIKF